MRISYGLIFLVFFVGKLMLVIENAEKFRWGFKIKTS